MHTFALSRLVVRFGLFLHDAISFPGFHGAEGPFMFELRIS